MLYFYWSERFRASVEGLFGSLSIQLLCIRGTARCGVALHSGLTIHKGKN